MPYGVTRSQGVNGIMNTVWLKSTLKFHNFVWNLKCKYSLWSHPSFTLIITWASCQIRKIAGCACAGNAGNVFPRRRFQRKLLVSDPGMHHGKCVTHVPWCMSGSLTCGDGENVPGIPGACATRDFAYLVRGPWCKWFTSHYQNQNWLSSHLFTSPGLQELTMNNMSVRSINTVWIILCLL